MFQKPGMPSVRNYQDLSEAPIKAFKITSSKMKHINTSKHLWSKVLGKQTSNVNIKNLIYRAIRNGEWVVLDNGTIGIHWKYAGKLIEVTGNVVNGVFKVGNAWVWNEISKLLF